tara:strand:- start:299 stop:880 length:582 start_codon:yes stop_codon:yes gene_type:complete
MMLTKIIVYGKLRKLLGKKEFEAKLKNSKQVFSFLTANYPQISKQILEMHYCIKLDDKYLENDEDIEKPHGKKTLRIIPIAQGSWVWLAAFLGGSKIAGAVAATVKAVTYYYAINYAANFVLKTLNLVPEEPDFNDLDKAGKDKSISSAFNGISNTVNAGVAVPICLGETFTGSVVISSTLDTIQYSGQGKET